MQTLRDCYPTIEPQKIQIGVWLKDLDCSNIYILSTIGSLYSKQVILTNVLDGIPITRPVTVMDFYNISKNEMLLILAANSEKELAYWQVISGFDNKCSEFNKLRK